MTKLFALLSFALAVSVFSQTPPLPGAHTFTFRTNEMHLEVSPVSNGWLTVTLVRHHETNDAPTPIIIKISKLNTGSIDVRWNGLIPTTMGVHYEIQRREESPTDGDSGWHRVGCVDSGQVQFIDYEPATVQAFYRVRSVAKNKKSKWSDPYPFPF